MLSTHVLNLSSKTITLNCESSEDVSNNSEEQYYKEPGLSRGVEGVDYGIVYGTRFPSLKWFTNKTPQWTEDDIKAFVHFWLVSMNM
jgi:hypothetical protein